MKILVIGDFHGKFPGKLKKLAREVDLVVSVGDFFPGRFNEVFRKGEISIEELEILMSGDLEEIEFAEGVKVIEGLDGLGKRVLTTVGNYDGSGLNDQYVGGRGMGGRDALSPLLNKAKNIERIDYRIKNFGGVSFIGAFGHSSPGDVRSKAFREHKKKLRDLFSRAQGVKVFVVHNMPYGCELDVIGDGVPEVLGEHYGSKLVRWAVDTFEPELVVGGHFHENQGKVMIGKSLVVNAGPAFEGKGAIIDFDGELGKVKSVRFLG